ncbi:phosphotransferase-like protein [Burkholderia cepacia]|uniref:phosphotransferase-like protein n=1 Tax=Burkholderia cepacia TaxID=292 RepID=UPI00158E0FED|nr:(d)CMP kinase [Burkholderia cepacia]
MIPITETLPPPGAIVVLNGPSSSGKSTLSKYLCENLQERYLHVELNHGHERSPRGKK